MYIQQLARSSTCMRACIECDSMQQQLSSRAENEHGRGRKKAKTRKGQGQEAHAESPSGEQAQGLVCWFPRCDWRGSVLPPPTRRPRMRPG